MVNSFRYEYPFNQMLSAEIHQQLFFSALASALNEKNPSALPDWLDIYKLKEAARICGPEVLTFGTADLSGLFDGVTLSVYKFIEDLYCARLSPEIETIVEIMNRLAQETRKKPVTPEAVWMICSYLNQERAEKRKITLERLPESWFVHQIDVRIPIYQGNLPVTNAKMICVIAGKKSPRVIGYRISTNPNEVQAVSLAMYDAISGQRYTSRNRTAGLVWRLPKSIYIDPNLPIPEVSFPQGLPLFRNWEVYYSSQIDFLHTPWWQDLNNRRISGQEFEMKFDNYLFRFTGYGPRRTELEREFTYQAGEVKIKDPAEVFPDLQQLLPKWNGMISQDGAVEVDGLHFVADLLSLWKGSKVFIRLSQKYPGSGWVYLPANGFLSKVFAREFIRKDGSFRVSLGRV